MTKPCPRENRPRDVWFNSYHKSMRHKVEQGSMEFDVQLLTYYEKSLTKL